jgi:hypothetical protein
LARRRETAQVIAPAVCWTATGRDGGLFDVPEIEDLAVRLLDASSLDELMPR